MHGGMSTGPGTPEGLERCRKANLKHGQYLKENLAKDRYFRDLKRYIRTNNKILKKAIKNLNRRDDHGLSQLRLASWQLEVLRKPVPLEGL